MARLRPVEGCVDRHAWSHRARDRNVSHIDAFRRRRLGTDDLIHERRVVRLERLEPERHLPDHRVHVATLVDAELDLAALRLANGLRDVESDGAGLWIRHQPPWAEHAT